MNPKASKKRSPRKGQKQVTQPQGNAPQHWAREGVESIVIAVVLALLFRTFEAEAFVIPTGSMAPTLQGRHKDVTCSQCGYGYRAGASLDLERSPRGPVVETNCPMCRYPQRIDPQRRNQDSFSGDRILVNKFAYQFGEPQRWDVIVFKFPGNAKQNYIKRLVGLPGETLRIRHGDVFIQPDGTDGFQIARKPPAKLAAMLQLVSDTHRIPTSLIEADWPRGWSDLAESGNWTISADRRAYTLASSPDVSWIRYRHIVPSRQEWGSLSRASRPANLTRKDGSLITDYYAYNDYRQLRHDAHNPGLNWVGDLALECKVKVSSSTGVLLLDLVEAGVHYTCRIDVATGAAQLSMDGDAQFESVDGSSPSQLVAPTKCPRRGQLSYPVCQCRQSTLVVDRTDAGCLDRGWKAASSAYGDQSVTTGLARRRPG